MSEFQPVAAPQEGSPAAGGRAALRPLKALAPFLWRYRGRAAAALAALVAAALATLAIPLAVRQMIDVGFSASDAASINRAFLALGALAGLLALASSARYYLVTTLGERIVADVRRDLFGHLMRLSPSFYDAALSGEILSRLTADTTQIKAAVGASASIALRNLMLFLGAAIMMAVTSPHLSALVLIAIPLIVLPIVAFGRQVRGHARAAQDALAPAAAYAAEAVGAVRTV